jgi:acyl-CoA reductase-like NAD-dependent aldehyde dehydrogenase
MASRGSASYDAAELLHDPGESGMKTITKHYIDGAFVESHGRKAMESINPTTLQVLGSVMLGDEEDARRAIAAAKRAFQTYSKTTKKDRSEILRRMHEVASARSGDLTDAMITEYGGVSQFASLIVQTGVEAFRQAEKALQDLELGRKWDKTTVLLEPVGVAGLITAWNANALFVCLNTASALAAGCTVVINPSEMSSLQTQVLLDCLHDAGSPKGIFSVVNGLGDTVGAELVRNPDVAKISFTGSAAVGEIFGPVLSVIAYDTVDEAVSIANDSKYGLHAFVSGTDIQRARRVAGQILAGRVVINGMRDDPQAPWGGFKHSGIGREYGAFGIEAFLEPRAILE